MGEAIAFDTHRFVKRLTDTGFTEAQAEALADEQVNLLNGNLATKRDLAELGAATERDLAELGAATKRDLAELGAATERDLAELGAATKRDLAELKAELLKWMIGAMVAQTGVIVGLVLGLT